MSKKVWPGDAISIVLLPSGTQGEKILDLALHWSRSWLLTPALWMLADNVPNFEQRIDIASQVPPQLKAYLLGRDSDQNPVKEEVDVFWTLGSQAFKKIRFVAVRTEQNSELMKKTSIGAETAARYIEKSIPETLGTFFKFNLVIAPTNERKLLDGVLSQFWNANLIAAAEDRSTPGSTDSFVKEEDRFIGFALAHIATTAGLWAGLPISSAEITAEKNQLRQARLQRVFVRGVANDALSADVAHWALQKLNFSDTNFDVGLVEDRKVTTIDADYESHYIHDLVEHIMQGPSGEGQKDNFLYPDFEETIFKEPKIPLFKKLWLRLEYVTSGIGALPKWIKASTEYRIDFALDEEADEEILYNSLPKKLAPKEKFKSVDLLIAAAKPKLSMPKPDLWRHLRQSICAAVDAPSASPASHPPVLIDKSDQNLLVFSTIDRVLPDPNALWNGQAFESGTSVRFEPVGWLDVSKAHDMQSAIQGRLDELAPGIEDARNQLAETQLLVDNADKEWEVINEDVSLVENELAADIRAAENASRNHTHGIPESIAGPSKRKRNKKRQARRQQKAIERERAAHDFGDESHASEYAVGTEKSSWRRFFGFRGTNQR